MNHCVPLLCPCLAAILRQVYYRKKKERQLQKEAEQAGKTIAAYAR